MLLCLVSRRYSFIIYLFLSFCLLSFPVSGQVEYQRQAQLSGIFAELGLFGAAVRHTGLVTITQALLSLGSDGHA